MEYDAISNEIEETATKRTNESRVIFCVSVNQMKIFVCKILKHKIYLKKWENLAMTNG